MLTEEEIFGVSRLYDEHGNLCCRDWYGVERVEALSFPPRGAMQTLFKSIRVAANFRHHIQSRGYGLALQRLSNEFYYRRAADARDKLYRLLGISDYFSCAPPIDYSRPVADCYAALASWMVVTSGSLDVLNMVTSHPLEEMSTRLLTTTAFVEPLLDDLPSWCPNWNYSLSQRYAESRPLLEFDYYFYNASSHVSADLFFVLPQEISSTGRGSQTASAETDVIDLVQPNKTDDFWGFSNGTLRGWKALAASTVAPGTFGSSTYASDRYTTEEALIRTVCTDIIRRGLAEDFFFFQASDFSPGDENTEERVELFAGFWALVESIEVAPHVGTPPRAGTPFLRHRFPSSLGAIGVTAPSRRFFVTERGHFGLGPPDIQEGDAVCVLMGGLTPYVLRPRDISAAGGRSLYGDYRFVGDAYVHGIMLGEAVEGSIETRYFRMR